MKIQFCSGEHRFPDWLNTDIAFEGEEKVDITQPLPYPDQSVDFVYCSHGVEHVTAPDAFRFFKECKRILKPGGVMRIVVPSIARVMDLIDDDYIQFTKDLGFSDGTPRGAIEHLITGHGHLACWDVDILKTAIWVAGFEYTCYRHIQASEYPELCYLEKHGEIIGEQNNYIESIIVEGVA